MRFLRLATPLMHGQDVHDLQAALNAKHGQHLTVDGQYGPVTKHAVGTVAYALGLEETVATPPVQRIIEGHEPRSPAAVVRAKHRAEQAAKAGQGLAGVLAHALSFVGVAEHPAGSNGGEPQPAGWIRDRGYTPGTSAASPGPPWCDIFYSSMVILAGGHIPSGEDAGYVPQSVANAKAGLGGYRSFVPWNGDRSVVKPGWGVAYAWNGSHEGGDHIGCVKEITADGVIAVEGNTSGTNASDGGMVGVMTRSSVDIVGYLEPRF